MSNISHVDLEVPDEAYSISWDGNVTVPTKNAIYDKIETFNPTNWDTAYGWGNHASAGYLTSLAFAGLSDYPADAAGALTNDGGGNLSWAAGGGGCSFGADNQIPYTNGTTDDFDYSATFTFDGTKFATLDIESTGAYYPKKTTAILAYSDTRTLTSGANAGTIYRSYPILQGQYTATSFAGVFGSDLGFQDERELISNAFFSGGELANYGVRMSVYRTPSFIGRLNSYSMYGLYSSLVDNGVYYAAGSVLAKSSVANYKATGSFVVFNPNCSIGSGNMLTYSGVGFELNFTTVPVQNSGTLVYNVKGISLLGGGAPMGGSSVGYAIYSEFGGLYNTNWFIYNTKGIDSILAADNGIVRVGTAGDAGYHYDGTNWIFNPKIVGSGIMDVQGVLQTDGYNSADGSAGATGSFTTADSKTVTVKNGIITAIV